MVTSRTRVPLSEQEVALADMLGVIFLLSLALQSHSNEATEPKARAEVHRHHVLGADGAHVITFPLEVVWVRGGLYLLRQGEEVLMQCQHGSVKCPVVGIPRDHAGVLLHAVPLTYTHAHAHTEKH